MAAILSWPQCVKNSIVTPLFAATNEGSIQMTEGEEFHVLEQDQGDGWTRVRRSSGEEGFVPTSYIEIQSYEQ